MNDLYLHGLVGDKSIVIESSQYINFKKNTRKEEVAISPVNLNKAVIIQDNGYVLTNQSLREGRPRYEFLDSDTIEVRYSNTSTKTIAFWVYEFGNLKSNQWL